MCTCTPFISRYTVILIKVELREKARVLEVVFFETVRIIDQTTWPKNIYLGNIRTAILEQ